jgi:hypothetical protein
MNRLILAALVGGGALILGNVLVLADPDARGLDTAADYVTVGLIMGGVLLTVAGLVAVDLRQRKVYGMLGRVGFVLAVVGQLFAIPSLYRWSEWLFLLTVVPGVAGLLLLAIAIARAPVLPHWIGVLVLAGFIGLTIVGDADLGIAFAGAVWLVVGYLLWSERTEPAVTPAPGPA